MAPINTIVPFVASALIILLLEMLIFFKILFFLKKTKKWKENEEFIYNVQFCENFFNLINYLLDVCWNRPCSIIYAEDAIPSKKGH
jgi:hypothetical protein